ncbi:MAG: hypothetical protein KH828_00655 [Clostridiales bacterium]|nr:hypothetical protein [Clostridiales bacterium]
MAKNDIVLKKYLSDKVRFADLINGSLFSGKQIVKPESLTQLDGEADLYLTDQAGHTKEVMRYRDVIMKADFGLYFAILAEENQMNVHYAMPVRNMLYDALSYTEQVEQLKKEHQQKGDRMTGAEFLSGIRKEDVLIPVITLVVYYGEQEWDGNLDLYGMMGIGCEHPVLQEIKEIIPNYKINLLHAGNIEKLENYRSSLHLVFGMLKYKSDKDKLSEYITSNHDALETMDEDTYQVIGVLLHEEARLKKYKKNEKVGFNMCKAIEEMIQDGRKDGIQQGIKEGVKEEKFRIAKELKGLLPDEVISEKTHLPLDVVKHLTADTF